MTFPRVPTNVLSSTDCWLTCGSSGLSGQSYINCPRQSVDHDGRTQLSRVLLFSHCHSRQLKSYHHLWISHTREKQR